MLFAETSKTAIKITSVIHLLWGILLIVMPDDAPRPFGGLEVYRHALTHGEIAAMFICSSALALISAQMFARRWWFIAPVLSVPQQVILVWALAWDVLHIVGEEQSPRILFSMVYVIPITYFHAKEVIALWHEGLVKRMTADDG